MTLTFYVSYIHHAHMHTHTQHTKWILNSLTPVMEKSGGVESDEAHLHCEFTCLSNWREGSKDLKTERKKSMALQ